MCNMVWRRLNNIIIGSIYREEDDAELRYYVNLKMDRICTLNVL